MESAYFLIFILFSITKWRGKARCISYDILSSFTSEYDSSDVTVLIINDVGDPHYFDLNNNVAKSSFEVLGDYTTVWEDI